MFWSCLCAVAVAHAGQDLPSILIFEAKPAGKVDREMNISVANYLANEFDTDGKARPIVYGSTDPVFRAAEEAGKLREVPKWPSVRQGAEIAHVLGARYVLVYDFAPIKKDLSDSVATLYDEGRKIWSERLNIGVKDSRGMSVDQTGGSLARTWATHVCSGPLRYVVAKVKINPLPVGVGQEPKAIVAEPVVKVDSDSQVKARVDTMIQAGDYSRAVNLLRDAVDQKPFDCDLRILLVQTLIDSHRPKEAGEEADRAVIVAPDRGDLHAIAARAWMLAGDPTEAKNHLNEVMVRDQGGASTRLMLAELSLARQEPDKALENLDAAIKEKPSRQAYYLRCLGRALVGNADGVNADLTQANKLPQTMSATEIARTYALAGGAIDDAWKSISGDTRLLMSQALVRPDDKAIHDKVAGYMRMLQARIAFMAGYPTPDTYKSSNDRRTLAHQLLVQAMLAMQSFFAGGGQDAMTDARVDLGEALKEAAAARSAFETEQKPPAPSGTN